MKELKIKYKALIIGLSLAVSFPFLFIASNEDRVTSFVENAYIIQSATEYFDIDVDECIKCQEGGWYYIAILITFFVLVILVLFILAMVPVVIVMRIFAGWSFDFTVKTLVLGRYPDEWKVTIT